MPNPQRSTLLPLIAFACAITLLRIAYLAWWCPYDLVEDEAQYWLWSKHLSWSYYSKGPGVAWAIGAATRLYGDAEWSVRLAAALSAGVVVFATGGLTRDLARSAGLDRQRGGRAGRLALLAAACAALAPFFQMSGVLMTIDGPLLASWAVACWAAWRAMHGRSLRAWIVLGLALGVGFLFKYTMVLLVPGLLLHAYRLRAAGAGNPRTPRAWIALCAVIALIVGAAPVLIWNAQQDWASFRHLLGHLGVEGGDAATGTNPRRWFEWLPIWPIQLGAMQVGLIGPLLILGAIGAWKTVRERGPLAYLTHAPLPLIAFYALVAWIAEPEGNWPIAAAVTLIPLGILWALTPSSSSTRLSTSTPPAAANFAEARMDEPAERPRPIDRRWVRILLGAGILYGVLAVPLLHRADIAARLANRIIFAEPVASLLARIRTDPGPPRAIVPGRLMGAREMGRAAGRALAEIEASTGQRPFIIAQHYGRASQMAYYVPWPTGVDGLPMRDVFCAAPFTGGRKSHFDLMPEFAMSRPDLRTRPALILSNDRPEVLAVWRSLFESVTIRTPPQLPGEHKRDRITYTGLMYRGTRADPRIP